MKTWIAIAAMLVLVPIAQSVSAETVPSWIKNNADWWAQGQIGDDVFVQGIQYLVEQNIIAVSPTQVSQEASQSVPEWVKNNAALWVEGVIQDSDFVNSMQHLVKIGVITVSSQGTEETSSQPVENIMAKQVSEDSELERLNVELEACQEITKAYKRLDCEKAVKQEITTYEYKRDAQKFSVGPVNYYWKGIGSEGNEFEISSNGQAILSIRMLAENTTSENVSLNCTSPQICNYDVWNGDKEFKYSGMDFTSGQIVLTPGNAREFNILFGPNIGYGGTQFEYDSAKDYYFRIAEDWGSMQIPLNLG